MSKYQILKSYEKILMLIEDISGSDETTNIQLDILGKHLFGSNKYVGTFSSDDFSKNIKRGQCFIMNNKNSRSRGEHFIAIYKDKDNGKLYGYDSFNRPIKSLSKDWIHKNIIDANTDRDQSFEEFSCGPRSLSWLVCFERFGPKIAGII